MLILIPCRWQSSRFPGKPLALIHGKPSIYWTALGCASTGFNTVLLTDDERIAAAVSGTGVDVEMILDETENGTERCCIYAQRREAAHYMIVAGDECCVQPDWLTDFWIACKDEPLATIVAPGPMYSNATLTADGYIAKIGRGSFEASGIYYYDHWNLSRYNSLRGGHAIELCRMLDAGAECKAYIEPRHPGLTLNTPDDVQRIEAWMI